MHYFSNKFSKIAKRWVLFAPQHPLIFNFGELKLRNYYDEIELQKINYDVTSF